MSDPDTVYSTRLDLDQQRQQRHRQALLRLDAATQTLHIDDAVSSTNPYTLTPAERVKLSQTCSEWSDAPRGLAADPPLDRFLYRITSFYSILNHNTRLSDRTPEELYNNLLKEFQHTKQWLPLTRLIDGKYGGRRSFTFWTTLTVNSANAIQSAYALGIPRNFLATLSVLLRCRVDDAHIRSFFRVPTILDGYDSAVFLATFDCDNPTCGHTINIDDPKFLRIGVDEYIAPELVPRYLQFRPLLIHRSREASPRLEDNSPLWHHLSTFYRQQRNVGTPPPR